jgi:hypothetical protein
MIHIDCEQRSDEWQEARRGIPTASSFHRLLTPTGKITSVSTSGGYVDELVAERLTGRVQDTYQSEWMLRGNELEPDARQAFINQTKIEMKEVGLFVNDTRQVGCSPDGWNDEQMTGLEIKCPKAQTHAGYLRDASIFTKKYTPQVQGALWITGAKTWHLYSYHPDMPAVWQTVKRDEEYIEDLNSAVFDAVKLINQITHRYTKD